MEEREIERTFLVNNLPANIAEVKNHVIKVGDFFDSNTIDALKIKQKGNKYFLIKKVGKNGFDRIEHAIEIKKGEFDVLWKVTLQNHQKVRYFYPLGKYLCEIDCYKDRLDGYVRVEVEFPNEEQANKFVAPDWFGEEITEHNHDIHEDLGIISFSDMEQRFREKNIQLKKL
jgi:CYTH domain-containing protein